jgi:phosphoglycerate dehydrogenase-like enzyme
MQILANAHKEKLMLEWQKTHKWGGHEEVGIVRDGVGMRLGVLGYGAIGRQSEFPQIIFQYSPCLKKTFD